MAAGVITTEQAERVAALARTGSPARPARAGAPVLAEVLGYLGGAVTIVTAIVLGNELWDSLAVAVRVLVLVAVTAAAVGAGAGLRDHAARPGGWPGSSGWSLWPRWAARSRCRPRAARLGPPDTALAASLAGLAAAAVLWWLHRETLQQLGLFVATVATLSRCWPGWEPTDWTCADRVWLLGLVWLGGTARGLLRPAPVGWVLGSAAAASGLLFVDWPRSPWLVVAC